MSSKPHPSEKQAPNTVQNRQTQDAAAAKDLSGPEKGTYQRAVEEEKRMSDGGQVSYERLKEIAQEVKEGTVKGTDKNKPGR